MVVFIAGNLSVPSFVRKTADQVVNNSSVLVDDLHLKFTGEADAVYYMFLEIFVDGDNAGNIAYAYTVPSGAVMRRNVPVGGSTPEDATDKVIISLGGIGVIRQNLERAVIIMGSTKGDIQLQWAQNSADASDLTVKSNSFLMIWKTS